MNEWISVKDRLPEANKIVLVNMKEINDIFCAYVNELGDWVDVPYQMELNIENLTHWQPLPEPPEDQS